MKPSFVIDIVVEIQVDSGGPVVQQKPAGLGKRVALADRVYKDGANGQRCF